MIVSLDCKTAGVRLKQVWKLMISISWGLEVNYDHVLTTDIEMLITERDSVTFMVLFYLGVGEVVIIYFDSSDGSLKNKFEAQSELVKMFF